MITFLMIVNGLGLPRSGLNPGYFQLGRLDFFPLKTMKKEVPCIFFSYQTLYLLKQHYFCNFFYMIYIAVCLPFKEEDPLAKVGSEAWQNVKKLII